MLEDPLCGAVFNTHYCSLKFARDEQASACVEDSRRHARIFREGTLSSGRMSSIQVLPMRLNFRIHVGDHCGNCPCCSQISCGTGPGTFCPGNPTSPPFFSAQNVARKSQVAFRTLTLILF